MVINQGYTDLLILHDEVQMISSICQCQTQTCVNHFLYPKIHGAMAKKPPQYLVAVAAGPWWWWTTKVMLTSYTSWESIFVFTLWIPGLHMCQMSFNSKNSLRYHKIIFTTVITSCGGWNWVMVNNQGDADLLTLTKVN